MDHKTDINILAFGDCNTSGIDEAPLENLGNTFVSFLKDKNINAALTNHAKAMFTTREGVNASKDVTGPADILLINFGLVDAWVTTMPNKYILYYPDNILRKYARKLLKSLKKRLRHKAFKNIVSRGHVVPVEEYTDNIKTIIKNVQKNAPNVKVVLWGIAPIPLDKQREQITTLYDKALITLASDLNFTYINTRSLFQNQDMDTLYFDGIHINKKGQTLVVEDIYNQIFPL